MKKLYYYLFPAMVTLTPLLALAQGNINDNSAAPYNNFTQPSGNYPRGFMRSMMGGDYPYFYGGHMLLWLILAIIFWVLVIGLIIYLIKYLVSGGKYYQGMDYRKEKYLDSPKTESTDREDAIAITKERYAKGEIDRKEYREKMDDLKR